MNNNLHLINDDRYKIITYKDGSSTIKHILPSSNEIKNKVSGRKKNQTGTKTCTAVKKCFNKQMERLMGIDISNGVFATLTCKE